jgi:hypothetical protein
MSYTDSKNVEIIGRKSRVNVIIQHGASFGSALAMAISFNINGSVPWAILHGLFSWAYVVYYCLIS